MTSHSLPNPARAAGPPTGGKITESYTSPPYQVLTAVSWTGNQNHLTSLRFHYVLNGNAFDGPLYGRTDQNEPLTRVTFDQTLRNLIASYYEHPDYGWIIKSVTFVTTNNRRHVAGPYDRNDAVFEPHTVGDIVEVFGICTQHSIKSIGVHKKHDI